MDKIITELVGDTVMNYGDFYYGVCWLSFVV